MIQTTLRNIYLKIIEGVGDILYQDDPIRALDPLLDVLEHIDKLIPGKSTAHEQLVKQDASKKIMESER